MYKRYSDRIKQEITINDDKSISTADGVYYSAVEVDMLRKIKGVSMDIHLVKKVFEGTIIDKEI